MSQILKAYQCFKKLKRVGSKAADVIAAEVAESGRCGTKSPFTTDDIIVQLIAVILTVKLLTPEQVNS